MSGSAYPDVPAADGVPPVLREPGAFAAEDAAMTEDAPGLDGYQQTPQWGLFDEDGNPALVGDSVLAHDFRKEYRVSDYPIEDGDFASFNKVRLPEDSRLTYTIGGSDQARADFIAQVDTIVGSLDLFTVVTRELFFYRANPVHYDFRRSAQNGVSLLTVDLWLREIRTTATTAYSKTAAAMPSGADPVSNGVVQPTPDSPRDTPSVAKPAEVVST